MFASLSDFYWNVFILTLLAVALVVLFLPFFAGRK